MKELQKLNYLKKVDLSYKYTSNNSFIIPSLKKIVFLLSIKNFLFAYDYEYSNTKESSTVYIKAFLFFYLIFAQLPFISIKELHKKVKYKESLSESPEYAYTLKLSFSSLKNIQNFFNFFIFENYEILKSCVFKNELVLKSSKTSDFVVLQTNFSGELVLTFKIMIQKFFEEINLKTLNFSLNLCLNKQKQLKNNLDLFNNLYL